MKMTISQVNPYIVYEKLFILTHRNILHYLTNLPSLNEHSIHIATGIYVEQLNIAGVILSESFIIIAPLYWHPS